MHNANPIKIKGVAGSVCLAMTRLFTHGPLRKFNVIERALGDRFETKENYVADRVSNVSDYRKLFELDRNRWREYLNDLTIRKFKRTLQKLPYEILHFRPLGFGGKAFPAARLLSGLAQVPVLKRILHQRRLLCSAKARASVKSVEGIPWKSGPTEKRGSIPHSKTGSCTTSGIGLSGLLSSGPTR